MKQIVHYQNLKSLSPPAVSLPANPSRHSLALNGNTVATPNHHESEKAKTTENHDHLNDSEAWKELKALEEPRLTQPH